MAKRRRGEKGSAPVEVRDDSAFPLSDDPAKKGWRIEVLLSHEQYRFLCAYADHYNQSAFPFCDQEEKEPVTVQDVIVALVEELRNASLLPIE